MATLDGMTQVRVTNALNVVGIGRECEITGYFDSNPKYLLEYDGVLVGVGDVKATFEGTGTSHSVGQKYDLAYEKIKTIRIGPSMIYDQGANSF